MKLLKKCITAMLCGTVVFGLFAGCSCGPNGEDEEPIDDSKTQLYVYNYDGGVGSKWLSDVKTDFEQAFAEKSFKSGKKGVQVRIERYQLALTQIPMLLIILELL